MKSPRALPMPARYETAYDALLADVAAAATQHEAEVTPFWPITGWKYDGSLMVIGRSVNGWIDQWPVGQLASAVVRQLIIADIRSDAEPQDRCRMLWVTDLAGRTSHRYNTNRSAFWRVLRSISADLAAAETTDWPSTLAWTNLYKIAPAAGWNPGADLQRAQRDAAVELLRIEIETWRPKRILAMTGKGWAWPFLSVLGKIEWSNGLVEGVGRMGSAAVVVARHPMKKPHGAFVQEVLDAFRDLA